MKIAKLLSCICILLLFLPSGCASQNGSTAEPEEPAAEEISYDLNKIYGRWEEENGDAVLTITSSRIWYGKGNSSTYDDSPDIKVEDTNLHLGLSDVSDMAIEEGDPMKIRNDAHTFYLKENWSEADFDPSAPAKLIEKGETIALDFAELYFDEDDIVDEIKFSNTTGGGGGYGGHITITQVIESAQDGKKFIYLKGRIKNLATYQIDPEQMKVLCVINDKYELEGQVSCVDDGASSVYRLDPLNSAILFLDTSIDASAVSDITKLDWYIGFDQAFSGSDTGNPKGSRYYYQITVK